MVILEVEEQLIMHSSSVVLKQNNNHLSSGGVLVYLQVFKVLKVLIEVAKVVTVFAKVFNPQINYQTIFKTRLFTPSPKLPAPTS